MHKDVKVVRPLEHITSDVGSIGDPAAGAETALGTFLLRVYGSLWSSQDGTHFSYVTQKRLRAQVNYTDELVWSHLRWNSFVSRFMVVVA